MYTSLLSSTQIDSKIESIEKSITLPISESDKTEYYFQQLGNLTDLKKEIKDYQPRKQVSTLSYNIEEIEDKILKAIKI